MNRFNYSSPSSWGRGNSRTASLAVTLVSMMAAVVLLFPTGARAQAPERTVYTTDNSGLPGNTVRALAIDAKGHIWIGTERGLAEFGSAKWGLHMSSDDVRALAMDAEGKNLWVGTHDGDLAHFDGANWRLYRLSGYQIRALAVDAEGNTWIGTDHGLVKYDGTSWKGYTKGRSDLPSDDVRALAVDGKGYIWIGTEGGLARLDGDANWKVYTTEDSGLPDNRVRALAADGNGDLWVGTESGLAKFDGSVWNTYLEGVGVGALAIDGKGRSWLGTDIGEVGRDGAILRPYEKMGYPIRALAVDAKRSLWIGTEGGGLAVYGEAPDTTPPRLLLVPAAEARSHDNVMMVWKTNEKSTSWVSYGKDETLGNKVGSDSYVKHHKVPLEGLEPGTEYHYAVLSVDEAGNLMIGIPYLTFWTRPEPDTTPPDINEGPFARRQTDNSANIWWTTDEFSDSWVQYGETTEYGYWARKHEPAKDQGVKEHSVDLSDLASSTKYYYRVYSADPSGNQTVSEPDSFQTKKDPDEDAPVVVGGPAVLNKTDETATVTWTTDEPSDSWVKYWTLEMGEGKATTVGDERHVREHTVLLAGLSPGTTYSYQVSSTDPDGNGPTVEYGDFTTGKEKDTDPPVILTGPIVYWTDEMATVEWTTDEQSTSVVYYGTAETYGDPAREVMVRNYDRGLVTDHEVKLKGLKPGLQYLYRIVSEDLAGPPPNKVVVGAPLGSAKRAKVLQPPGWGGAFTTNLYADTQVPVILSGPGVVFKSDSRVTVGWETDERSDSVVEYEVSSGGAGKAMSSGRVGKAVAGEEFPYRVEWAQDVLDHEVTLTHLDPGVLVRYRVGSVDPSGNGPVWSGEGVVETDRSADEEPPKMVSGPEVLLRTDRSVMIGWDTDEPGDSVVEYGEDADYGGVQNDMGNVMEHRITLTHLKPSTVYHIRVGSTDPSGNGPTWSGDMVFETQAEPDVVAPKMVSGPEVVSKTDVSVVIAWETNELADSYVKFGEDMSYGFNVGNPEDVLDHRVELTNLHPATAYHYHVGSIDRSGNGPTESGDAAFTTDAAPDVVAPAAPSELRGKREGGRVELRWRANEEGDVVGYNIYRREEEGAFEAIATLVSGVGYVDAGVVKGKRYGYRITAVDGSANESEPSEEYRSPVVNLTDLEVKAVPQVYALGQNFPNPFNSFTRLEYQLPQEGEVELSLYNVLGQQVRTLVKTRQRAGFYSVLWDGRDAAGGKVGSGIYLVRAVAGNFTKVRKMALLR